MPGLPTRTQWVANMPLGFDGSPMHSAGPPRPGYGPQARQSFTRLPVMTSESAAGPYRFDGERPMMRPPPVQRPRPPADWCCRTMCIICLLVFLVFVLLPVALALLWCGREPVVQPSQGLAVAQQLGADWSVGWWSMPEKQPMSGLRTAAEQLYMPETRLIANTNMSFGSALGREAVEMMYANTKVGGVWESVPEKLRGVFWVRGDGPEKLVSFQYSRWFAEESTLVVPSAPMTWAWADGTAVERSQGMQGFVYSPAAAQREAANAIIESSAVSFRFSACPPKARYCQANQASAAGPEENSFAYASIQVHPAGSLKAVLDPASATEGTPLRWLPSGSSVRSYISSSPSLQEVQNSPQPGALWAHASTWSLGTCNCPERGSYMLMKVLDADGEPLEPYYTDFLQSQGDDPVYLWAGWPSEEARVASGRRFQARAMMS